MLLVSDLSILFNIITMTSNKKKVTLKPEEMEALLISSKIGGDVELFMGIADVNRIKHNVNKCLVFYLNQDNGLNMDKDEIEDLLMLQIFLENLQKHEST